MQAAGRGRWCLGPGAEGEERGGGTERPLLFSHPAHSQAADLPFLSYGFWTLTNEKPLNGAFLGSKEWGGEGQSQGKTRVTLGCSQDARTDPFVLQCPPQEVLTCNYLMMLFSLSPGQWLSLPDAGIHYQTSTARAGPYPVLPSAEDQRALKTFDFYRGAWSPPLPPQSCHGRPCSDRGSLEPPPSRPPLPGTSW